MTRLPLLSLALLGACLAAAAPPEGRYLLDPFAVATLGYPGCPTAEPPYLSEYEYRVQAHERIERGTSCALAGTCEPGGAYKRDPEVNERVRAALVADARFASSSLWVSTMRGFVTLKGCVRSSQAREALTALVQAQPGVLLVWNETWVGTKPPAKPSR